MLELEPTKRATLEEVIADPWIVKTDFCRQEVGGRVLSSDGHQHILCSGDETEVKIAKRQPIAA